MQRWDLRHLHGDFYTRMRELIEGDLKVGEVGIFLFEMGDFTPVEKAHALIKEMGHELMNSLKFNEPDWTIVVKKLDEREASKRALAYREELEARANEQAQEQ